MDADILAAHRERLKHLEIQAAQYGISTPAEMSAEIERIKRIINTEEERVRIRDEKDAIVQEYNELVKSVEYNKHDMITTMNSLDITTFPVSFSEQQPLSIHMRIRNCNELMRIALEKIAKLSK